MDQMFRMMVQMLQQQTQMQNMMVATSSQAAPTFNEAFARGIETQSAGYGNHNFSQLLTNLSNIDKSKGSHGSSGGTIT